MDCLNCKSKACKIKAQDCTGTKEEILREYQDDSAKTIYQQSDKLVAGGRAGTLSRVEEILEFVKTMNYHHIALAYCFGIEKMAEVFRGLLLDHKLKVSSYRCTINGIREKEIDDELGDAVNCNPIGQAEAINESDADFVIEMGLCLGHDVLFHQHLEKPFTVLIVKDRVYNHNPGGFFNNR